MGSISRNPTAPYADGEELHGKDDLEVDLSNLYQEFDGRIDDTNVKAGADIAGSKLADGTISNAKFVANTITPASINNASVARHAIKSTSSQVWPTDIGRNWSNITGITLTTITLAVGDMVLLDFEATLDPADSTETECRLAFAVGGDTVENPYFAVTVNANHSDDHVLIGTYAYVVDTAGTKSFRPRGQRDSGSAVVNIENARFRIMVLPGKGS